MQNSSALGHWIDYPNSVKDFFQVIFYSITICDTQEYSYISSQLLSWFFFFFYWVFIEHIIPCCKAQCIMQIFSTLSLWLPCKSISILTRRKPEQMLTFWPRGSGHKCRLLNQELHCAMHVSDSLGRLSSLLLSERTRSLPQAYILWPFTLI